MSLIIVVMWPDTQAITFLAAMKTQTVAPERVDYFTPRFQVVVDTCWWDSKEIETVAHIWQNISTLYH